MGQMRDLIGAQGAAAAGVLGPAEHPGLEEGAIDDQLPAALEQVEQANLTPGPVELVLLLHRHPRHPSTLGSQRITGAGQGLLLHEELLARSLPLLLRHDRGCLHREMTFRVLLLSLFACCHLISPLFSFLEYPASIIRRITRCFRTDSQKPNQLGLLKLKCQAFTFDLARLPSDHQLGTGECPSSFVTSVPRSMDASGKFTLPFAARAMLDIFQ